MSVSPADFLESAAAAISHNPLEIDCRNAASRAYYSAIHNCRSIQHLCPSNEHFVIDGGSHARLIDIFASVPHGQPNSMKAHAIAYILKQMRRVREWADYEINKDFAHPEASNQVTTGNRLVDKVAAFQRAAGGQGETGS